MTPSRPRASRAAGPVSAQRSAIALPLLSLLAACGEGAADPAGESQPQPPTSFDTRAAEQAEPEAAQEAERPKGRWHARRRPAEGDADRPNLMEGLGYASAYNAGGDIEGAVVHDRKAMAKGMTLVCSGHDTSVLLMDAEGEIAHHWHVPFEGLFGDDLGFHVDAEHTQFIRRAYPYPNGDLLLVFEYIGIARVNRDGEKVWSHAGQNHHDFELLPDGRIATLGMHQMGREAAKALTGSDRFEHGLADNTVVFLTAEGEVEREISIAKALVDSDHAALLGLIPVPNGDVFHANSVDVLDAEAAAAHPAFDEGDILVSMRTPSALLAIDGESGTVKWTSQGVWRQQHQAWALPSGRILLLDNCGGNGAKPLHFNRSRVLEFDPVEQDVTWQFPPKGVDVDFFTHYLGYVERLPNGNTLITESTQGHMIEVDAEGKPVWEYFSPFRAGDDEELITTLMGGRRIPRASLGFLD